jgi:stage II sporulation protein D
MKTFITHHLSLITIGIVYAFAGCMAASPYYRYETPIAELEKPPYLQVSLTQYQNVESVKLTIDEEFHIYGYEPVRRKGFISDQPWAKGSGLRDVRVSTDLSGIAVGNIKSSQVYDAVIVPSGYLFKIGQRPYRGYLRIKATAYNKISLINIIDLESYLPGVVSSELDSSWPEPALASQAIASRTYALYHTRQNRLKSDEIDYDLTDDIFSQVYRGEERTNQRIYEVVNKTRGVILTYQGKIFNALFHATCGGQTEPGHLIFGVPDIPPLQGHFCGFCQHAKYYHWQVVIPESEIITKLNLKDVSGIESISIVQRTPGGHALIISLTLLDGTEILWGAQKFRIALDPNRLRSTNFTVRKVNNSFEFTGHGWGHGVGMCQEGARGMALQGFNPLQILEYYYPQSEVVRLIY